MGSTERKKEQSRFQYGGMWIKPDARLAIYLRDRFRCLLCNRDLHWANASWITLDHIATQRDVKDNRPGNLYTCCKACNCSRGARPLREYAERPAYLRVLRQVRLPMAAYRDLAQALIAGTAGP